MTEKCYLSGNEVGFLGGPFSVDLPRISRSRSRVLIGLPITRISLGEFVNIAPEPARGGLTFRGAGNIIIIIIGGDGKKKKKIKPRCFDISKLVFLL